MNIEEQKKTISDSFNLAAMAKDLFQTSQGLPIDSVDDIAIQMSGANESQLKVLTAFANLFDELERFLDELPEQQAPLKELNDEVRKVMKAAGFEIWETGGGCTAWGKNIIGNTKHEVPYMMVTMDEASAFYSSPSQALSDEAVLLCFYNASGDWVEKDDEPQYFTWKKFKEMCEG